MAAGTIVDSVADNRDDRDDVDAELDDDGANYSWVQLEWQHGLPNDSRHEGGARALRCLPPAFLLVCRHYLRTIK